MRIGELAKNAGLNPKTIRYYEEIGLLPPARRTGSGYRQYASEDVERLEFIRTAQGLSLALDEIREILSFRDRGESPCPHVLLLIDKKTQEIEARIRGLRGLAEDLKRLRRAATHLPPEEVRAKARFCHIIENRELLAARRVRGSRKGVLTKYTTFRNVSLGPRKRR
ncbi:MAG: heavy metal-responsive transcriptional regulator [bacterium]